MNKHYLADLKELRARWDKQLKFADSPTEKALIVGQVNGLDMAIRLYESYNG